MDLGIGFTQVKASRLDFDNLTAVIKSFLGLARH